MNEVRNTAPVVDDDEETREETPVKVEPNPEKIGTIDSQPEDQKEVDGWVDNRR